MLTIYIEEAHAVDEWVLPESEVQKKQVNIKAHATLQERMTAAAAFVADSNIESEVVVDSMQAGNVADVYWAWPERLYIILDGLVVYQGVSFCFLPHTHTHTHTQHNTHIFRSPTPTTPHHTKAASVRLITNYKRCKHGSRKGTVIEERRSNTSRSKEQEREKKPDKEKKR